VREESASRGYEIRANQPFDLFFQKPTAEKGLILIIHQYEWAAQLNSLTFLILLRSQVEV
jgi:hypothetical protein